MLDDQSKAQLEARYFPALEETIFGPLYRVLERDELQGAAVLDAGCGKGSWILRPYRERFRFLAGVDVYVPPRRDADVFSLAKLESMPFESGSFDLVVCYLVLEHIADPARAFVEFARLLRPGGLLLFKTPAAYAPTTLLARALPFAAHWLLKRFVGTEKEDVFPTYYRCNTLPALRRQLGEAGLTCEELVQIDQTYAYLSMARWSYVLGLLYSRALHQPALAGLRNGIIGICRKEAR